MKYFFLFLIFGINNSYSQQISSSRKTDWSKPGACLVIKDTVVYINNFGGDSTGVSDNTSAFNSAKTALGTQGGTIKFSEGTYLFTSSLSVTSGIKIKGEGSKETNLIHNLSGIGNLFNVTGSVSSVLDTLIGNSNHGADTISVSNSSLYQIGDYIKLVENDGGRIFSTWASNSIGQICKIVSINSSTNQLKIDKPLRQNYSSSLYPRISIINPKTNIGFECFSIKRLDATTSQSRNFHLNYTANCHFIGIRSDSCNFAHIAISNSTNISVKNCFFKNGFNYGSGGKAYGVVLQSTTGNCLIENNQFEHLRHSVLLQSSANGNVISYNYSKDPYWTGVFLPSNSAGDLVLHGNYPYMNLFEGNICQNIVIDNSHGLNGKFNTFLRNRAENYGVFMNTSPASDSQNFVGNEITNTTTGLYSLAGNGHYSYGNNYRGNTTPAGTNLPFDNSYYLKNQPVFWTHGLPFPFIGESISYNQFTIPAYKNYSESNYALCMSDTIYHSAIICPEDTLKIGGLKFTNPGNYIDSTINSSGCNQYVKLTLSVSLKPIITSTWFLESTPGVNYQWYLNGTKLIGDSIKTLSIHVNGYYQVLVTDSLGCRQLSDSLLVSTAGIKSLDNQVKLFPNPANNSLNIEIKESCNCNLDIYSALGQKIKTYPMKINSIKINISDLEPGIYFIRIENSDFKFIKL